VIGGEVNEVGANAAYGSGEWLVVEADESDGTFLRLGPEAAIVTSVEPDHLDYYGGFEQLVAAFEQFVDGVPGPIVGFADDEIVARIAAARPRIRTYGRDAGAHYRIVDATGDDDSERFTLLAGGRRLGELVVPLAVHAATNATGAAALALELGVPFDAVAAALRGFGGVARRFERRGELDGVTFVDDYAHLPTEVKAALATAADGGWRRVVCVFQPHRYSRTQTLAPDFADAFVDADILVVTDVYPAGEAPRPGVSGKLIVNAVLDAHPMTRVAYFPRREPLVAYVRRILKPGDLCLVLGAGDVTSVTHELLHDGPAAMAG
jgi:UDP-N-acetylmuramate--alanine ligase